MIFITWNELKNNYNIYVHGQSHTYTKTLKVGHITCMWLVNGYNDLDWIYQCIDITMYRHNNELIYQWMDISIYWCRWMKQWDKKWFSSQMHRGKSITCL